MSEFTVKLTGEEAAVIWRKRQPRPAHVVDDAISKLRQMREDFVELRMRYSARIPPECMAVLQSAFDRLSVELKFFADNPGSL